MGLLNPAFASQLPFQRPVEDPDGNRTYTQLGALTAIPSFTASGMETRRGPAYRMGMIYVTRPTVLLDGDEFSYDGFWYRLVGVARGDMLHPFTGADFGWVSFEFQGGEVKWI